MPLQREPLAKHPVHPRLPSRPGGPEHLHHVGIKRSLTGTLVCAAFGRPRRLTAARYSARSTMRSPTMGVARSKNSSVSSGASSGSIQGLRVFFDFLAIGFSHADDAACLLARRPDQDDMTAVEQTKGDEPVLAGIISVIPPRQRWICEHLFGACKVEAPLRQLPCRSTPPLPSGALWPLLVG